MTTNQLGLIRSIAENKLSEARKYAISCCAEDKTQKNAYFVMRYKNMLENATEIMELPLNIKGMAQMEDVSCSFREDRYYLSEREKKLFNGISNMNQAGLKLMEMGIQYLNAILLTGASGTGKTTFGRYVAYKLKMPFLYINFSYLIDSYMGKTAQNLRNVFDFARTTKCILMLDEIDCIAQERKGGEGSAREFSNTTVSLLQELDKIQNDSIIIGATNIPDIIDPAVCRRFALHHEILPLMRDECVVMVKQYLNTVNLSYEEREIEFAVDSLCADSDKTAIQSKLINYMITRIADSVINNRDEIVLE